jgi:hypothetical protein
MSLRHPGRVLGCALGLLLLATPVQAQELRRDAPISPELGALSDRLVAVQRLLAQEFGVKQIYVGGGSSRTVLDNLYFGKPLQTRDIDLFVVADRKVTPAYVQRVASRLLAAQPGQVVLQGAMERRPRGNPALSPEASARYNAGYGFFLRRPDGEVLDISFYHTPADLGLNGCLNVDTVMIPLRNGATLGDVANELRGKRYAQAVRRGIVVDDHDGYKGWQENRLNVAHPAELTSKPVLWTIRLARSFGKAEYNELPKEVVDLLRQGDAQVSTRPRTQLVSRYMRRLLEDGRAEVELKMVKDAGVLQHHAGTRRLLGSPRNWQADKLRARLAAKAAPPKSMAGAQNRKKVE